YLTPEETFEAVRTRHVDAAVMWSPPAGWLAKKASGIELTWVRDPEGEVKIAVGMRKEDRGLKSAVDQTIKRLVGGKEGEGIRGRCGVPFRGIAKEGPTGLGRRGARGAAKSLVAGRGRAWAFQAPSCPPLRPHPPARHQSPPSSARIASGPPTVGAIYVA